MNLRKINKDLIYVFIMISIVTLNILFIYRPIKNKEARLLNQIKVIKKLQQEELGDNKSDLESEDLILSINNYFKGSGTLKYIKSDRQENFYNIEISINGNKSLLVEKIMQLESLNKKIFIEGLHIKNIDNQNVDCEFKINIS